MSPIEKNCSTWAYHHSFSESSPSIKQHIFHKGVIQEWEGGDTAPNSSVKVTPISKQFFLLGWPDSSLWPGDQDGEQEGELSNASGSHRSITLWSGMSTWPSIWRLTPDISSARSLDLAAMDTKLVAVNWNFKYSHSKWVQRPWQEMKQTTWFELTASLSHCLGLCLYTTNRAPSQMWGCFQPGRKVVTYLQEPPSLANWGTVTTLPQLPLLNQIWDPPHY